MLISNIFPIPGSLINEIIGLWKFNTKKHFKVNSMSTIEHQFHYIKEGELFLTTANNKFHFKKGDIVYYYDSQKYIFETKYKELIFYSMVFYAPLIKPKKNKITGIRNKKIETEFLNIFNSFNNNLIQFYFHIHKYLDLLFENNYMDLLKKQDNIWWEIENTVRKDIKQKYLLNQLVEFTNVSKPVLIKKCLEATGVTPMKRIKMLKLNYAKMLLMSSDKKLTEISNEIGYDRIHEFSRDFKKYFNISPGKYRLMLPKE